MSPRYLKEKQPSKFSEFFSKKILIVLNLLLLLVIAVLLVYPNMAKRSSSELNVTPETNVNKGVVEELIYEGSNIRIWIVSIGMDTLNDSLDMKIKVENQSQKDVSFYIDNSSVNDFMADIAHPNTDVKPGKTGIFELGYYNIGKEYGIYNIDSVENISGVIHLHTNDWSFLEEINYDFPVN